MDVAKAKYTPSDYLLSWFQREGFVPSEGDCWEKAWDHSSGFDSVALHLFPWDGRGGFNGESYCLSVRNHASGTNPTVGIGIAHNVRDIMEVYRVLSALTYDDHQAWIASRIPKE